MNIKIIYVFCVGLILASAGSINANELSYAGTDRTLRGAVATVNPIATKAALDTLTEGGNAIDAAVAAALTLGVIDGHNSGIGGGCFILVRWADGRIEAIDGREMAPAAAFRDMYLRDGKADKKLSKQGALAVGIPGSIAAYDYILRQGGRESLKHLLGRAADIAEQGYLVDGYFARRAGSMAPRLDGFPELSKLLLDSDGKPVSAGSKLVQPDLAHTYRQIGRQGIGYFYGGEFAQKIEAWMKQNGGIVTAADFEGYELKTRAPLKTSYRKFDIYGFPPPSSGGVHVAQILNILENFDVAALSENDRAHLLAEAMKLAFADRAHWLGDPDFAKVPRGLITQEYADKLAKLIQFDRASEVAAHGTPANSETDIFGKHTTHIAAADKEGNWVAITTTVNTSFGSKVIVPGTGVILNNQMDDFSIHPGVPNAFGLVGTAANSIAPGKRPLSSMSPTIVMQGDLPVMTLGAAGGPTIISSVLQTIVNVVDLELPLEEALAASRLHHQWRPNKLIIESSLPQSIKSSLEAKGHSLRTMDHARPTQAIMLDDSGAFTAVAEPRVRALNAQHEQ